MYLFVILGALATLVFSAPYAWATLQGKIQPNRISWCLWSVAPGIGLIASIVKNGWLMSEIPVLISVTSTGLVFICSLINRESYWALTRSDWLCGFCSALALIAWAFTQNPVIAIILSMIADFMAVLPTFFKALKHPESEIAGPYLVGIFNALTSFTVMDVWNFSSLAFPIYLTFANALLSFAILGHKIKFSQT